MVDIDESRCTCDEFDHECHCCPYHVEINYDNRLCNCCPHCENRCALEV